MQAEPAQKTSITRLASASLASGVSGESLASIVQSSFISPFLAEATGLVSSPPVKITLVVGGDTNNGFAEG